MLLRMRSVACEEQEVSFLREVFNRKRMLTGTCTFAGTHTIGERLVERVPATRLGKGEQRELGGAL